MRGDHALDHLHPAGQIIALLLGQRGRGLKEHEEEQLTEGVDEVGLGHGQAGQRVGDPGRVERPVRSQADRAEDWGVLLGRVGEEAAVDMRGLAPRPRFATYVQQRTDVSQG